MNNVSCCKSSEQWGQGLLFWGGARHRGRKCGVTTCLRTFIDGEPLARLNCFALEGSHMRLKTLLRNGGGLAY